MSKNEFQKDQAEELRKKIKQGEMAEDKKSERDELFQVSSLPPRSKVHKEKKQKSKYKMKYPLIRLLVFFFILLPFIVISIYTYSKEIFKTGGGDDYEQVNFEQNSGTDDNDELSIPE